MASDKLVKYDADKRFNWSKDEGAPQGFSNDDLVCKGCMFETEEVDSCKVFKQQKPGGVMYGGACPKRKS